MHQLFVYILIKKNLISGSFQFGIVTGEVKDLTNLTSNHGAYINDDMKTGYFGRIFESKMIEGQAIRVTGMYKALKM